MSTSKCSYAHLDNLVPQQTTKKRLSSTHEPMCMKKEEAACVGDRSAVWGHVGPTEVSSIHRLVKQ